MIHQATRKHITGDEKEVYIIILSKNKDILSVKNKVINQLKKEENINSDQINFNVIRESTNELFFKLSFNRRGREIPLIIGIADLCFNKE